MEWEGTVPAASVLGAWSDCPIQMKWQDEFFFEQQLPKDEKECENPDSRDGTVAEVSDTLSKRAKRNWEGEELHFPFPGRGFHYSVVVASLCKQ